MCLYISSCISDARESVYMFDPMAGCGGGGIQRAQISEVGFGNVVMNKDFESLFRRAGPRREMWKRRTEFKRPLNLQHSISHKQTRERNLNPSILRPSKWQFPAKKKRNRQGAKIVSIQNGQRINEKRTFLDLYKDKKGSIRME